VSRILVDPQDAWLLEAYTWRIQRTRTDRCCYVRASTGEYLHRLICEGEEIDHINGDGLDNRRANLRAVPHRLNMANQQSHGGSSRFKGVCWDRARGRWTVGIKVDGIRRNLGRYDDEEEAAKVYDAEAILVWGPHARLNFT